MGYLLYNIDDFVLLKEQADAAKKEARKKADNDGVENLKSALLISAAVVVIIGAVYAVVRKIK